MTQLLSLQQVVTLLVIFVTLFLSIMSTAVYLTKRKKVTQHEMFVKYNRRYNFYYDFALTRKLFRKVYAQVTNLAVYNFMEARVQTVRFFERSLAIAGGVFVITLVAYQDIIAGLLIFLFAVVLLNSTISKRIDDVNYQGYVAISKLCSSLMEAYTRVRNVPDAINQCNPPKILEIMVEKIYLICTAKDGEERLTQFFQENQNRELRTIAVTCYLRNDIGEDPSKGSPFKQALRLIKDEVDAEVLRQLNMRIMFRSLEYLPFIALVCYPIIKFILTRIIPATSSTFVSPLGYALQLILILVVLVCYYILSTMNNASVARVDDRFDFITQLLYHDNVRKFARSLMPKDFKKRDKLQDKINGCLSSKNLQYIALEQFVLSCVFTVVTVLLTIVVLISSRRIAYNSLMDTSMTTTLTYTAQQQQAVLEYQHAWMKYEISPADSDVIEFLQSTFPKITTMETDSHLKRLHSAVDTYHSITFKWYFAFLFMAAWFIGRYTSIFLLNLRAKLVQSEAELDVLQLQTIIAILMDTPLDTLGVIYWLSESSDIHKDILTYCYHEYTRDPELALSRLKDQSAIAEFSDMCDKLKTTIAQVTLSEAFEDLVVDRANTMAIRNTVQMDSLRKKRSTASPIAKAPMMVWLVTCFILPIVMVALQTATSTLGNLGQLGGR